MMGSPALFDLFVNNILKEIMNKTSQLYLDLIINKRMYFRSWLDNMRDLNSNLEIWNQTISIKESKNY